MQELVKCKAIAIEKVAGGWNQAGLMTKAVPKARLDALLPLIGLAPGRSREDVFESWKMVVLPERAGTTS